MDKNNVNIFYLKLNNNETYKLIFLKDVGNNFIAENIINSFEVIK